MERALAQRRKARLQWTVDKLLKQMAKAGFIIKNERHIIDRRTMADKISALEKRLKEVNEKFNALRKSGIDEELLIIYLQHKTKLSKRKVKEMLKETQEFFDKLVSKEVAEEL